jgi:HD-GYP domain-containing protein (c-di-GMP phosphodiesterase class II)
VLLGLARAPDVQAVEPADRVLRADDARLDRVAEAFAGIVDAKSPYTARHCAGVAEIADGMAATMGVDDATRRLLRRAGAPARRRQARRLQPHPRQARRAERREWGAVRRHPRLSMVILRAVPALAPVARLSATHHERLDGSGYPYGLTASELKLPDRILQVADVTDALTSERPYREALSPDEGCPSCATTRASASTPPPSRPSNRGCPSGPRD